MTDRPLIFFLLPFARWGGPGSLLSVILGRLTRHRALVGVPPGTEQTERFRGAGADVVEVPGLEVLPRPRRPAELLRRLGNQARGVREILRIVRRTRPVLLHSCSEGLLQGGLAARWARLPALVQAIGMTIFRPRPVGLAVTRLQARLHARLLCAQPMIRNEFLGFGADPARLVVLPNCIEPEQIRQQAQGVSVPPGDPIVTMVAGMDRRKGHDFLIRAAAHLRDRGVAARIRLVGSLADDPSYHAELRGLVAELGVGGRVEFLGQVACPAVELAQARVHVVPSRIEALPLAGQEAMALGLPVVATRVGGNPYLVADGETGLLANPGDPLDLAMKIAHLLERPTLARTMGEAGRTRAARLFEAAVVVPQLETLYDEVLAEHAARRPGQPTAHRS